MILYEVRGLKHEWRKPKTFVQINYEQNREMGDLDDGSIEPDEMLQGHTIAQGHEQPRKYIAGGNVGEKGVILNHGDGIDGKYKSATWVNTE